MTEDGLRIFYKDRSVAHQAVLQTIKGQISGISNLRIGVAVAFLIIFYFAFSHYWMFYILPFVVLGFVVLVQYHSRLFDRRTHLENLIRICQHELQAADGNISVFESGANFIDGHHAYTHDLDIFGEGSVFQYINRCHTTGGKALLAARLAAPMHSREQILQDQEAVGELATLTDFRHEIQARGMEVEELPNDRQQLREWVTHPSFLYGKIFYKIILVALPILTLLLLMLSFYAEGFSRFFWVAAAAQWTFLGFRLKQVNKFHQYISRKKNILIKYAGVLREIEAADFKSSFLQQLSLNAKDADDQLSQLGSLVGAFDARLNSLTNLFVNSLLMYDLQCIYRLEKWKDLNAQKLEGWMEAVEQNELLCSFATFAFNHSDYVFPSINTERALKATAMAHPMIEARERVANDIEMDDQRSVIIVTGANMAGKSTFLRTLGVNIVLALNGAPVCAGRFDCPVLELRTGMRTADSLRDHQSYFYAELNRLKSIMDDLKGGKELLILLDEILKGTNSTDKQAGSLALVKQLAGYPALVVVATHDLALGDLEKEFPERVRNFCFEPSIIDDQLSFDYKLKRGLAEKMNATFLMKKMGIIPADR
jgi:hypothetical protein